MSAVCLLFQGREIDEMAEDNTNNNNINDEENYSFEQEEGGSDLTYYEVSEGLFTFFHQFQLFVYILISCLFTV